MPLHLFAGVRVCDFRAARPWYEQLLGEPTFFPHATEAVWTLAEHRSVYLVEDPDGAGKSVATIFVDDLDAHLPQSLPAGWNLTRSRRTSTASARRSTATPTATSWGSAARRWTPDTPDAGGYT